MTFKLKEELAKIKKELYPVVMIGKKKVVTKYTPDVIENVLSKVKLKYNKNICLLTLLKQMEQWIYRRLK